MWSPPSCGPPQLWFPPSCGPPQLWSPPSCGSPPVEVPTQSPYIIFVSKTKLNTSTSFIKSLTLNISLPNKPPSFHQTLFLIPNFNIPTNQTSIISPNTLPYPQLQYHYQPNLHHFTKHSSLSPTSIFLPTKPPSFHQTLFPIPNFNITTNQTSIISPNTLPYPQLQYHYQPNLHHFTKHSSLSPTSIFLPTKPPSFHQTLFPIPNFNITTNQTSIISPNTLPYPQLQYHYQPNLHHFTKHSSLSPTSISLPTKPPSFHQTLFPIPNFNITTNQTSIISSNTLPYPQLQYHYQPNLHHFTKHSSLSPTSIFLPTKPPSFHQTLFPIPNFNITTNQTSIISPNTLPYPQLQYHYQPNLHHFTKHSSLSPTSIFLPTKPPSFHQTLFPIPNFNITTNQTSIISPNTLPYPQLQYSYQPNLHHFTKHSYLSPTSISLPTKPPSFHQTLFLIPNFNITTNQTSIISPNTLPYPQLRYSYQPCP